VVAIHPMIGVIAYAHADEDGFFIINLPDMFNVEIVLPERAVSGIEAALGEPVLIIVP